MCVRARAGAGAALWVWVGVWSDHGRLSNHSSSITMMYRWVMLLAIESSAVHAWTTAAE